MAKSITIPVELLRDLYTGLARLEEILATLEEYIDEAGLERIRGAEEEFQRGDFVTVQNSNDLEELLSA
ncbi:MAG: hypothetical protein K9W43_14345 [Candidatus Thorarchaeota archaeon]|nr:hypothetical protein [Candidatus Thorarchaeota archaeon]